MPQTPSLNSKSQSRRSKNTKCSSSSTRTKSACATPWKQYPACYSVSPRANDPSSKGACDVWSKRPTTPRHESALRPFVGPCGSRTLAETRALRLEDLTAAEFERRLRELTRRSDSHSSSNCVECHDCVGCSHCTFCRDGERLSGCHYCVACKSCVDCSHCRGCERLLGCQHCIESQDCSRSKYVVLSSALSNCAYCFGCVGLSHKEFHILNQPFPKTEYFELTARLAQELDLT